MSHDPAMTRITTWIATIATAAALAAAGIVATADAATAVRWSNSHGEFQQALSNVRHPHPTGPQLAGGNRTLKAHGCPQRIKHPPTQH